MSTIIEASDIACASAAADLFGGNGLSGNQQCALVAQLFADHRAKAQEELRAVRANFIAADHERCLLRTAVEEAHDALDVSGLIPKRDTSHRSLADRIRALL